jgi:hypothetical protein
MIDDLEVEGLCTHAHARWDFISVLAPAQEILYCCKEIGKLIIAGHTSTPVLLASTELTIGNKLDYDHSGLSTLHTNRSTPRNTTQPGLKLQHNKDFFL